VATRDWPAGGEVRLVTAFEGFHMYATAGEDKFARARLIQEAAQEKLRDARLAVSCVIEEEDPKHLLVKEAARWQAESIFVGARELSRFGRLLLGSVSTAVVSRAECSVEVVRPRLEAEAIE
jgi:nucleotide-binding universal stress UspA family protein